MIERNHNPSATSLPQAPHEEAAGRLKRYALTMGVRTLCFVLMFVVQPLGWWTWLFAAGAIVLPYIAVVFATTASTEQRTTAERPERELQTPSAGAAPQQPSPSQTVITIAESSPARALEQHTPPASPQREGEVT